MGLSPCITLNLLFLCSSLTVHSASLLGHIRGNDKHLGTLEARQEPGVVATSNFVRRGFHACEYCG
jgi:hypothetical protein